MSVDRYFVDSNVVLYTYDKFDRVKRAQAKAWVSWLWDNANGALSWQVLQEFYFNALRKFQVPAASARDAVRSLAEWNHPDVTIGLMERAWYWVDEAQLSFWDAMILAAAERAECRYLLSEDFQPGQKFDSVTVVNPFKTSPPF